MLGIFIFHPQLKTDHITWILNYLIKVLTDKG